MKKTKLISIILILVILLGAIPATTITAEELNREITSDNLTKLATAFNTTKATLPYDKVNGFGTRFPIFNADDPNFVKLFTKNNVGGGDGLNHEADSLMELSSQMASTYGASSQISGDIPLPGASAISLSSSLSKNTSVGSNISSKKYFNHQFYIVETATISVLINWDHIDPTNYFESNFIKDYQNIKDKESASKFLNTYGSHLFKSYTFGGMLELTKSVVSEVDISETYEENNKELNLKANFDNALSMASNGSSYDMNSDEVSNTKTASQINVTAYGGSSPDALTPEGLFLITQQIGNNNTATSYPLRNWKDSIYYNRYDEQVIKVADGIAIWDIVKKSSYHNDTAYSLLKQAYSDAYLESFANMIKTLDPDYSFIVGATSTNENGYVIDKEPNKKELTVSPNSTTTFKLDKTYLGDVANVEFKFSSSAPKQVSLSNNALTVGNVDSGSFNIDLYVYGMKIDTVTIKLSESPFSSGTGAANDPYVIKTASEFLHFINDNDYYTKSFSIQNDINLKGEALDVGGAQKRVYFSGNLNGNGHTIYNASIISDSKWGLIGLFGANSGTISNLKLDNIKCLNQGVISTVNSKNSPMAAGILCGYNKGTINNVIISNCAIRVSSDGDIADEKNTMSFGGVVGTNDGKLSYIGVSNVKIHSSSMGDKWSHSHQNSLKNYVGGIIGQNNGGDLKEAYVANVNITSINTCDNSKDSVIGGCIGYMTKASGASVTYCVVYDVTLDNQTKSTHLGYICGQNAGTNAFGNCLYDAKDLSEDKSVDGKPCAGCSFKKDKIADVVNSNGWKGWKLDENEKPVLK